MQQIIEKEKFYIENVKKINKIIEYVLLFANIVPVAFFLLILFKVFPISYGIPLVMAPITVSLFVIDHFLNKSQKERVIKFSMYFGMFASSIFVCFLGSNHLIHLFVSFGFVPFMSSLYYDKKLNLSVLIVNYFLLAGTLFFRSLEGYKIDPYQNSAISWFITYLSGFTVEYIFVFLISRFLTKKNVDYLDELFESQQEQQKLIEHLNETSENNHKISEQFKVQNLQLQETQTNIIKFIAKILGSHDLFTGRHVIHTQKYVDIISRQLRKSGFYTEELTDENINLFTTAAFLHDIGKIHIPEGVLNKMGKFTDAEFHLMQCHPEEGVKLLNLFPKIEDGKFNQIAKDMCYYHHEKWDGSGYPNKIKGKEIPLCARIMACADVLDALISERLYKKPFSIEKAMEIFEESKGSHFEPCIADAVIACKPLIFMIDADFKQSEESEQSEELKWWTDYHNELQKRSASEDIKRIEEN